MSSKMLLSALAVVATVAVVASPQDPSFEFPTSKYIGYDLQRSDVGVPSAQSGQTRRASDHVSVTFKNATVREVLDWLKDQGVSFVLPEDQVDRDARISINAVNQPLEALMQSLARSWQGHWERNNDIWVFQKGVAFFAPLGPGEGFKTFETHSGSSGQKLTKEQQEEIRKAMEKLQDSKVWEQHAKDMEKWSKDFEKQMQGKKFDYKMDPKAMEELQKKMEGMKFEYKIDPKALEEMKALGKDGKVWQFNLKPGEHGFMWDGKDMKPLNEAQIKEMTERAMKMSEEAQKFWKSQDGKARIMDEKAMKELREKMNKLGKDGVYYVAPGQSLKSNGKNGFRFFTPDQRSSSFTSHNLKAIYDSLTPAQEKMLETRGFLRYSDLNANQRAMLGIIGDDSWTISYKAGKVNITIKSDR